MRRIVIDPFCYRQFGKDIPYDIQAFEEQLNKLYSPHLLIDGYAPFCKHLFVENFTEAQSLTQTLNESNEKLVRTRYERRTQKELPVLIRYLLAKEVSTKRAKFLDIILYSKEQIQAQNLAMDNLDPNREVQYEYGVVSVKPQDVAHELPMDPITMMRNSLGKQEGGSGVSLQREKYLASVEYWEKHVRVLQS